MQHLFQSPFLQALGFAIANSLWQAALVWLVFVLLNSVLTLNAANKYRLAVDAQIISFSWFIITLQFYYSAYHDAPNSPGVATILPDVSRDAGFQSQLISWMAKAELLLPYLSAAYLILMLALCIRWFFGYRHTQAIRANGTQKIAVDWRLFVQKTAVQLGINRKVQILLSETIHTPLTIGFLKPLILIPVASINHLTVDQLEAVILHEMAHIKRHDYLVNIVLSVVELSLFFNPFTQLLSKTIKKERENSCDDWVLQFQYNATTYAAALLQIAYLQAAPVLAMTAAGDKKVLLERVKRMIDQKENQFNYRRQLLAFCLVTGLLSTIAWLNPDTPHKQQPAIAATQKVHIALSSIRAVAVEPMAVKISNPLFNPAFFLSEPLKKEVKKNIEVAAKAINTSVKEVASVTPAVADAIDAVSNEMTDMQLDKALPKTSIQIDSAIIISPASIRVPVPVNVVKEGMGQAMIRMEADIKRAREEIKKLAFLKMEMGFDEVKIRQDVIKALEALKKVDLDQVVFNAMKAQEFRYAIERRPKPRKLKRLVIAGKDLPCPEHPTTDVKVIVNMEEL
jgi:beta-lactamase regulating signal transducer with metallopeptidase domain